MFVLFLYLQIFRTGRCTKGFYYTTYPAGDNCANNGADSGGPRELGEYFYPEENCVKEFGPKYKRRIYHSGRNQMDLLNCEDSFCQDCEYSSGKPLGICYDDQYMLRYADAPKYATSAYLTMVQYPDSAKTCDEQVGKYAVIQQYALGYCYTGFSSDSYKYYHNESSDSVFRVWYDDLVCGTEKGIGTVSFGCGQCEVFATMMTRYICGKKTTEVEELKFCPDGQVLEQITFTCVKKNKTETCNCNNQGDAGKDESVREISSFVSLGFAPVALISLGLLLICFVIIFCLICLLMGKVFSQNKGDKGDLKRISSEMKDI